MKNIRSHVLTAIFKQLKSRPTFESVGIKEYRSLLDNSARVFKPDPSVNIQSFTLKHINATWLTPRNAIPETLVLYIHGGGYIAGSIRSHRDLASRIASAASARTLIFEYRLAPEHPFPAGLDDVQFIYEWLGTQGYKDNQIHIVGDSAGGGLSLGLLARLDSCNASMPASATLLSPWVDLECQAPSHYDNAEADPMLGQSVLLKTARMYTDKSLKHPSISPINHPFQKLCPLLIHAGENEVLLDDSKRLAQKVEQLGIPVHLKIWEEMFHVWHYFARYLPAGRKAIEEIGQFIQSHTV